MMKFQRCKIFSIIFLIIFGLFVCHKVLQFNRLLNVIISFQIERSDVLKKNNEIVNNIVSVGATKLPLKIEIKNWDFKINNTYAIVFFGRKRQTEILLRYLERNVKVYGGVLDKIVFAVKTNKKEDLEYLESIMTQKKPYIEKITFTSTNHYREIYLGLNDDDLVFKIDDDIVFIANGTFERMIQEYMENKLLFLSGNVVNHPLLSYVHARMRAIKPHYEESPYKWKRYSDDMTGFEDTIAYEAAYDAFSKWWEKPQCAAMAPLTCLDTIFRFLNINSPLQSVHFDHSLTLQSTCLHGLVSFKLSHTLPPLLDATKTSRVLISLSTSLSVQPNKNKNKKRYNLNYHFITLHLTHLAGCFQKNHHHKSIMSGLILKKIMKLNLLFLGIFSFGTFSSKFNVC